MSEYRTLFEAKYKKDKMDYGYELKYLFMLYAPKQYGVEDALLKYVADNPHATLVEVSDYFDEIVPDGILPKGISESDLL